MKPNQRGLSLSDGGGRWGWGTFQSGEQRGAHGGASRGLPTEDRIPTGAEVIEGTGSRTLEPDGSRKQTIRLSQVQEKPREEMRTPGWTTDAEEGRKDWMGRGEGQ